MKSSLSFALLTISLFSLNTLPVKAVNISLKVDDKAEDSAKIICEEVDTYNYIMVPFPEDRKAIDVGDFVCDYSLFSSQFSWKPRTKFQEGIKKSIEYFRNKLEHYI